MYSNEEVLDSLQELTGCPWRITEKDGCTYLERYGKGAFGLVDWQHEYGPVSDLLTSNQLFSQALSVIVRTASRAANRVERRISEKIFGD